MCARAIYVVYLPYPNAPTSILIVIPLSALSTTRYLVQGNPTTANAVE